MDRFESLESLTRSLRRVPGVREVLVVGSVAKGKTQPGDLDLLVNYLGGSQ